MPPSRRNQPQPGSTSRLMTLITALSSPQFWKSLLFDPDRIAIMACVLLVIEVALNIFIIERVRYTEIDWKAYMQEVEGVLNGTFDYSQLKGDTGPLVYPAGFVYIYMVLYYATQQGQNIKIAQYIFFLLYIIYLLLVFRIYVKSRKIPPIALFLSIITSYRVHSIFVLRLFNDPIAMIFLYAAINFFMDGHWTKGSLSFSAAVSVKMNILLFAPALLVVYLTSLGLRGTITQLSVCAGLQILLGLPFLISSPSAYLVGAFNVGRVFMHKWTVNWRFLSEEIFVDRRFHFALLGLHIFLILIFLPEWTKYLKSFARLCKIEKDLFSKKGKKKDDQQVQGKVDMSVKSRLLLLPLFTANLIGIACARSLHYQFYVWYYHTLPYLVWSCSYSDIMRLSLLGILELCWNTYPSTEWSSAGIHFCHVLLLVGLLSRITENRQLDVDKKSVAN